MKVTLGKYDYDKKETVLVAETDTRTIARSLDTETMAELLSDYVNTSGNGMLEGEFVGEALTHTHRTLQRLVVCWAIGLLKSMGKQVHTDARNESAIETARKIGEMYEDGTLPLGRFI